MPEKEGYILTGVSREGFTPFQVAMDDAIEFNFLINHLLMKIPRDKASNANTPMADANASYQELDNYVKRCDSHPEEFNEDDYLKLKKQLLRDLELAALWIAKKIPSLEDALLISLDPKVFPPMMSLFQSKFYHVAGIERPKAQKTESANLSQYSIKEKSHSNLDTQNSAASFAPQASLANNVGSFTNAGSAINQTSASLKSESKRSFWGFLTKLSNWFKAFLSPPMKIYKTKDHTIALANLSDLRTLLSFLKQKEKDFPEEYTKKLAILSQRIDNLNAEFFEMDMQSNVFSESDKQYFVREKKQILQDIQAIADQFFAKHPYFVLDSNFSEPSAFQALYARLHHENISTTAHMEEALHIDPAKALEHKLKAPVLPKNVGVASPKSSVQESSKKDEEVKSEDLPHDFPH